MIRIFLSTTVLLALAYTLTTHLATAATSPAKSGEPLNAAIVKQIDQAFSAWDNTRTPGAAIAVSRSGKVVFARGYGMSNLEHDVPITPDSIFHIASISKQFTTACVALLAAEGKVSWSDDVRKHVPELPDYGRSITLAHLAHHTSGLRDQWSLLQLAGWREDDLVTEADVLAIASRQKSLNFAPGEEYLYCNTGFTLLAIVVKRVSGQTLRDFAAARFFSPLGMNATHFHSDHTEIVRGRTSAYQPRSGGGWKISIPVFDTYGATSLFTTVGDLLTWEQNFVDARVGGPSLVASLIEPGKLNDGSFTDYGLGVVIGKPRGVLEVGHGGADAGYRTDVVRFPEHDLAIAVFCNLSNMRPAVLSRQVAEIILGPGVFSPLPVAMEMAEAELKALVGNYWNEKTDDVRQITLKDGKLSASGGPDPLIPIRPGEFRVGTSNARVVFPPPVNAAAQEMQTISATVGTAKFTRVVAPEIASEQITAFTGTFSSDELVAKCRLTVSAGAKLELRSAREEPVTLAILKTDTFYHRRIGTITFTRGADGKINGLTISTGRVRRLPLVKSATD